MPFLLSILVALVLAGLVLWVVTQLPLDPTVAKIIRVVVIVAVVLWLLSVFTGYAPVWPSAPHYVR